MASGSTRLLLKKKKKYIYILVLFCWTEYYTSHQDNYYDTVYTIQRLMDKYYT